MTDKQELLPCPFCGGEAEYYARTSNVPKFNEEYVDALFVADCTECNANIELEESQDVAIKAWNNRPIEKALRAENERLREALELADAALSGANMNMNVVNKKVKTALKATKKGKTWKKINYYKK